MPTDSTASFEIQQEALSAAIVELNSMSPCDGVIMTRSGQVKVGYENDFSDKMSLGDFTRYSGAISISDGVDAAVYTTDTEREFIQILQHIFFSFPFFLSAGTILANFCL